MAFLGLRKVLLGASAAFAGMAVPASALNIVLAPDNSFTGSPNGAAALLGFQKAANYWNQTLSTNVTLTFDVHFASFGSPNTLGATYSNTFVTSAVDVYAGLAATGNSTLDATALANLRPLSAAGGIAYRTPGISGGVTSAAVGSRYDNDNTINNRFLNTNTSIDRALGLAVDYSQSGFTAINDYYAANPDPSFTPLREMADADITFSSDFAFDFDPTDGVAVGTYDFVGVAIHEMGHALGFVSGTDDYDYTIGDLSLADVQNSPVLTTLDLFRYGANNPHTNPNDPLFGTYDLQLDPNRPAFFSVDARNPFIDDEPAVGTSTYFSTGANYGDGGQASHWQDVLSGRTLPNGCFRSDRQVGIMDPTLDNCRSAVVTGADLAAMDAMGWNLANLDITQNRNYTFDTRQAFLLSGLAAVVAVPEPTTWAMMIGGFGFVGGSLRRRRQKVTVTFA